MSDCFTSQTQKNTVFTSNIVTDDIDTMDSPGNIVPRRQNANESPGNIVIYDTDALDPSGNIVSDGIDTKIPGSI